MPGIDTEEQEMIDNEHRAQRKLNQSEVLAYLALDRLQGSMSPEGFTAVLALFASSHGYLGGFYMFIDILSTWNIKRKRKV